MIELSRHIEVLLLENDCVIVPGLGGFIAHYRSSCFKEDTGEFCPPARTIGFNPQLVINDGLLVQSYMQAYNTDFPDATRKIEKVVEALEEKLYHEGEVTLEHVGTLYYNMDGEYGFEPAENSFFTPTFYGLEAFVLPPLRKEQPQAPRILPHPGQRQGMDVPASLPRKSAPFAHRRWIKNAVAVAAAILLFFMLSVPVENTYMDGASYASLGSAGLFDAIRDRSAASCIVVDTVRKGAPAKVVRNNVNTLKPVAVKTEKIAAAPAETAQTSTRETVRHDTVPAHEPSPTKPDTGTGKGSYVIVASLPTAADAQREVGNLKKKGHSGAEIVEADGRFRVAISRYDKPADAYRCVQTLKEQAEFKSAWVFTVK